MYYVRVLHICLHQPISRMVPEPWYQRTFATNGIVANVRCGTVTSSTSAWSVRSEHRLSSEGCARVFALASGTIPIAAPQPPMPHLPWSRAPRSPASSISKQQSAQHLYMDASGSFGVGALAYPHWFQIQWGESPRLHPSLSRIYCPQWWRQLCGGTSGGGHTYRAMQTKRPQWPRSTPFTPGIAPQPHSPLALLLGLLPSTLLDAGSAQSRVFKHKCQ